MTCLLPPAHGLKSDFKTLPCLARPWPSPPRPQSSCLARTGAHFKIKEINKIKNITSRGLKRSGLQGTSYCTCRQVLFWHGVINYSTRPCHYANPAHAQACTGSFLLCTALSLKSIIRHGQFPPSYALISKHSQFPQFNSLPSPDFFPVSTLWFLFLFWHGSQSNLSLFPSPSLQRNNYHAVFWVVALYPETRTSIRPFTRTTRTTNVIHTVTALLACCTQVTAASDLDLPPRTQNKPIGSPFRTCYCYYSCCCSCICNYFCCCCCCTTQSQPRPLSLQANPHFSQPF